MTVKEIHLQDLKKKSPAELLAFAEELEVENASSLRKQDMMFSILKQLADDEVPIVGDGVLDAPSASPPGSSIRASHQQNIETLLSLHERLSLSHAASVACVCVLIPYTYIIHSCSNVVESPPSLRILTF